MPLTTAQLALSREIQDWLLSRPTFEEIQSYASAIPEDQFETISDACQEASLRLSEEKKAYFEAFGSTFATSIPENIQIEYLGYLSEYSVISVQNKLNEAYPNIKLEGPDIPAWSLQYLQAWWSLSAFAAYKEYERQLLYLHSLSKVKLDLPVLQEIRKNLESTLQTFANREVMLERITQQDEERLEDTLRALKILPDDYIEAIVEERPEELEVLLIRLIQAIQVAEEFTDPESATIPQESIDSVLLELVREDEQQTLLRAVEVHRLREQGSNSQFGTLRHYLDEHIFELTGENFPAFQEVLAQGKFPPEDLKFFLYSYIRYAEYPQMILDDLDIDLVIEGLKQIHDLPSLETYIEKLSTQVHWEDLTSFKNFIHFLHKLVHTIPE